MTFQNCISRALLLFLAVFFVADTSDGQDTKAPALTLFTENYPPLNYEENGEAKGLSVDLLLEVLSRAKLPFERHHITVVPWARGYSETQQKPNTILFSTVRLPEREELFKWVGPIGISRGILIARKDSPIRILNENSFAEYTYGVVQHARAELALKQTTADPEKFIYVNSPLSAAHMLARGRVDAWAFERIVSFWVLQKLGYRSQDFRIVHSFDESEFHYALNLHTDQAIVDRLQAALDEIRADGTLEVIVEGHIPGASASFIVQDN